jgi:predicted AlkP superfamily phosphohydrolase/phosphomutase
MSMKARAPWLLAAILLTGLLTPRAAAERARKVVVLGFDGADPALVRQYMAEGVLPHLKALQEQGTFQDLTVTNPPQTPVSWGAFTTGLNPGRNRVFDFLIRNPKTYKPAFALMEEGSRPFLLGNWNRWVLPLVPLAALPGLTWLAFLLVRRRMSRVALLLSAAGGLLLAAGFFSFVRSFVPSRVPKPINHLVGQPFWETAAKAGKKCLVFRVPDSFPARPYPQGRLLSGLGVPDIRGRVGTPYVFTDDPSLTGGDNEFSVDIVPLDTNAAQPVKTSIQGPFNKPFYEYVVQDASDGATDPKVVDELKKRCEEKLKAGGVKPAIDVPLTLSWDSEGCTYEVQGQRGRLKTGQWSPWVVLTFEFNRFLRLHGMARFYLLGTSPSFRLYLSPIHLHPEDYDEGVAISYPPEYAERLLKRFGFYKTMGWAVDTWTISSGLSDEAQFLSDMNQTVDAYENMMRGLLRDGDWDLYVQVYEFTDRAAHILWQYMDPRHPLYRAGVAPKYQEELRKAYVRMDTIVGEAMALLPPDTALVVLSDHGFASFRKAVNYNRWLIGHGYMALKADTGIMTLQDLFDDNRLLFKNVDWSKTRAYALGLGNVYINLKGREREGIVEPGEEYAKLCEELKRELPRMVDPDTGERPVFAVYTRDELYKGYDPDLTPDLRVTNTPGYRVSWQTSLGGAPEALLELNEKAWSGDHCSMDPSFVPGMFFSNRKVTKAPDMLDMAPSVLELLGVPRPADLEGKAIVEGGPAS